MDLQLIKKFLIISGIWSALFLSILITNAINSSGTMYAWVVFSLIVGGIFTALKSWNKTLQEPVLDVNLTHTETTISIVLAMLVNIFGGALLQLKTLQGLWTTLLLAFVMTTSQYTLIKSAQPDPASPTHGFNRVVLLSKPIYFCLLSALIIACDAYISSSNIGNDPHTRPSLVFYSFDIFDKRVIGSIGSTSLVLIQSFPVIFPLGLLPQITTFIIYILEQVDIHFFGSTAATLGIRSAAYSFLRSLLAITLLYLIALEAVGNSKLFSLFCGLLISSAYFLSRNSSDATAAYRIFRRFLHSLNPSKHLGGPEKIELSEIQTSAPSTQSIVPNRVATPQQQPATTTSQTDPVNQPDQSQISPKDPSSSATSSSSTTSPSSPTSSTTPPSSSTTASTTSEADEDSTVAFTSPSSVVVVSDANSQQAQNNLPSNNDAITVPIINDQHRLQRTIRASDECQTTRIGESVNITVSAGGDNNNPPNGNELTTNTLDREDQNSDAHSVSTRIQSTIDDICLARVKQDLVRCLCLTIIVFALHVTTVFQSYYEHIERYFGLLAIIWGILFHFVIPQFRRDLPCLCLAKPILRPKEYDYFEVKTSAKLMWFEKMHFIASMIETNLIYPIFWLNVITHDSQAIKEIYGQHVGPLILVVISFKLVRSSFNDPSPNYITIIFTYLFFNYDVAQQDHCMFAINYFLFTILHFKIHELLLKLQFIYIYIAPWQIPWGSACHAFAQPFSVPHSALLFFQAILSSILSAPLQPVLGSAIFMMSYVRPTKFWERDYNTNVIDINSTRLVTQLERNRIDSNRLDGVFYEHLTKCLQRRLCRDLSYGRWGPVSQGDCFIMASDNLNCLVHIIELGNGVCTFQLRGLEFRGTYCQQQEVEAITEGVAQDDGFCCCEPGRLPFFLSANASFNQFWLAWHVTHTRYVLEGYSIADNAAGPMLQPFDLRRALITYYVKSLIYFTITSNQLSRWLKTREFHDALEHTKDKMYADLDPSFSMSLDQDFDVRLCGVTRAKFCSVYFDWIKYCMDRVKSDRKETQRAKLIADLECTPDSFLVSLCFGLSLLARRSLSAAADGQQFYTVESLLFGLHALLKGDFRVTSLHDEWIFQEMKFFNIVVIPAVRMALKLHQDHFAAPDDYEDNMALYEAIAGYQKNLVISHETDVAWRAAVLSGVPSLLTLRLYSADDGSNQYKFITLNRRYLSFRIIKINRECVRGLWASQQQELIYFRNTDPERGSIQNAKQALRNMINSSCDQPVGYPIYVSPLTTSYVECGSLSSFLP